MRYSCRLAGIATASAGGPDISSMHWASSRSLTARAVSFRASSGLPRLRACRAKASRLRARSRNSSCMALPSDSPSTIREEAYPSVAQPTIREKTDQSFRLLTLSKERRGSRELFRPEPHFLAPPRPIHAELGPVPARCHGVPGTRQAHARPRAQALLDDDLAGMAEA